MAYEVFEIERDAHVATLWLANPAQRNAMGPAFWDELPRVMDELGGDETVRAIVIAARGEHFTVGLDLKAMGGGIVEGGNGAGRAQAPARFHPEDPAHGDRGRALREAGDRGRARLLHRRRHRSADRLRHPHRRRRRGVQHPRDPHGDGRRRRHVAASARHHRARAGRRAGVQRRRLRRRARARHGVRRATSTPTRRRRWRPPARWPPGSPPTRRSPSPAPNASSSIAPTRASRTGSRTSPPGTRRSSPARICRRR